MPSPHAIPIQLAHVGQWFFALSDVTRLAVLELLAHRERCSCELLQVLEMDQAHLAFHLRVLRQSGLIKGRREGRLVTYRIEPAVLDHMTRFIQTLTPQTTGGTCPLDCCR